MSMKIINDPIYYQADALTKPAAAQSAPAPQAKLNGEEPSNATATPQDEYIGNDSFINKPSGLYRLSQDENGKLNVLFDDPAKRVSSGDSPAHKANSAEPGKNSEECTANTDKVDREIERLRKEKQQLDQQLQAASNDEAKAATIERKLAKVASELLQKDNDTYRRQNTIFS